MNVFMYYFFICLFCYLIVIYSKDFFTNLDYKNSKESRFRNNLNVLFITRKKYLE